MRVALDPPVSTGQPLVAAVCQTGVLRLGAGLLGIKRPVAVLVRHSGTTRVFHPDGSEMTTEEVDALCPGALETFETNGGAD